MTKYQFLLLSSEKEDFIARLQDLGMVDIDRSRRAIDKASKEVSDRLAHLRKIQKMLDTVGKKAENEKAGSAAQPFEQSAEDLYSLAEQLSTHKEQLLTRIASLKNLIAEARPWGDFPPNLQEEYKAMNLKLHAFVLSENRYNPEWESLYPLLVISNENKKVCFVVVEQLGQDFHFPAQETAFPSFSYTYLEHELKQKEAEVEECDRQLLELSYHSAILNKLIDTDSARLDAYLAVNAPEESCEGYISIFTGFVPSAQTEQVDAFLANESLYFTKEKAVIEDNPPVVLKNNWFSKLYEPIGAMYMLPTYNELDLTPYFAPFYMLFFGLCLGDMGYGLIILLVGIFGRKFAPKMKPYLNLAVWLGAGTVLMALLPGSFFGMSIKDFFPAGTIKEGGLLAWSNMQLFWFSIIFGVVQILFARLLNAIFTWKNRGLKYALSGFGWSFFILWCVLAYAGTMNEALKMAPAISYTLLILGAGLILFFTKTEGNIVKRLFGGVTAFYDITGVFGDLLSYIRLFGLGASGSILAMVINAIAMSLTAVPYVGYVLGVILLLFGHCLVFGLCILGAFVHPMRLTFVEFYKNAGFTGGGRPFRPLTKTTNN